MSETLRQRQSRFALAVSALIAKAYEMGYTVTLGDAYRDPRVHGEVGVRKSYSHPKSAHKVRLAIDLNLFSDGEYLDRSDDHKPLGEWWENAFAPDAVWGGRFGDGNHYSFHVTLSGSLIW